MAGARKPVVVAEGLLGYFSMPERRRVASAIAEALDACGGGAFVCDLRAREGGAGVAGMARALKAGIRIVTRGRGAREDFADHDAVRRYFSDCNFSRCRTVAVDAVVPHLSHLRSPGAVWIAAR